MAQLFPSTLSTPSAPTLEDGVLRLLSTDTSAADRQAVSSGAPDAACSPAAQAHDVRALAQLVPKALYKPTAPSGSSQSSLTVSEQDAVLRLTSTASDAAEPFPVAGHPTDSHQGTRTFTPGVHPQQLSPTLSPLAFLLKQRSAPIATAIELPRVPAARIWTSTSLLLSTCHENNLSAPSPTPTAAALTPTVAVAVIVAMRRSARSQLPPRNTNALRSAAAAQRAYTPSQLALQPPSAPLKLASLTPARYRPS